MKRQFLVLFLFSCFVVPVVTTYGLLQFQKKMVKKEVKWKMIAGLDMEELVLLKFTEQEKKGHLNWKHSREFAYRGEMYDIVETAIRGDTTYYWVWWDHEETALNKQLSNLVAFALGHHPTHQENNQRLHDFFKSLFLSEPIKLNPTDLPKKETMAASRLDLHAWLSVSPPSPPPEFG